MAPHLWSMWKDIKNFKVIIGTTGYHILLGQVRTRTPYWQRYKHMPSCYLVNPGTAMCVDLVLNWLLCLWYVSILSTFNSLTTNYFSAKINVIRIVVSSLRADRDTALQC